MLYVQTKRTNASHIGSYLRQRRAKWLAYKVKEISTCAHIGTILFGLVDCVSSKTLLFSHFPSCSLSFSLLSLLRPRGTQQGNLSPLLSPVETGKLLENFSLPVLLLHQTGLSLGYMNKQRASSCQGFV